MIFIENIVFSNQKIGGISVVWHEHVRRLANDWDLEVKFIEYAGTQNNILRRTIDIPQSKLILRNSVFLNFRRFFNVRLAYRLPFIFHSSSYRIAKNKNAINFITVHDFIYFLSTPKGIINRFLKCLHCQQIRNAIQKADYIICVSNNTKFDLLKFIPNVEESKISVVYNGVSNDYFPITEIKYANLPYPPNTYVLFVGSRSNYKNFRLAVAAVSKTELSLVIVGKELSEDEIAYIKKQSIEDRYKCLSGVDNVLLNQFYNAAFCLLYPSSYEGFGIPIIEAQKAGCPVIAYDASSVPEIIGKTPLLIKELSIEEIHHCFTLLKDKKIRNEIIEDGIKNSKKFSWDKTYEQIKKLYESAVYFNSMACSK
ncbi:MAG: glycosyltransferase family 4 protein [Bacteroidales bacterium]|nr:glycosyltransferase family 4 protein [Bacteroidales bacterium]